MDTTEAPGHPTPMPEGRGVPKRKLASRLSFGHIVMISAGLVAFLLNVMIIRGNGETVEVLVAAHPISAGSRLAAQDVVPADVDANGPFVDRVLSPQTVTPLLGQVVVRDIGQGDPLFADDMRSAAAPGGGRAMSIPIAADHAVGATLQVGDRVDVISVDDGESRFVATGIEVLDVAAGGTRPGGDRFGVTVAVSEAEALAIAAALDRGSIHLLRSTGADTPEPGAPRPQAATTGPSP